MVSFVLHVAEYCYYGVKGPPLMRLTTHKYLLKCLVPKSKRYEVL